MSATPMAQKITVYRQLLFREYWRVRRQKIVCCPIVPALRNALVVGGLILCEIQEGDNTGPGRTNMCALEDEELTVQNDGPTLGRR